MKILFVLPRQHPNQAGWYHALERAGHTVKYIVSYSLPTNERQDLPEPVIIDEVGLPFLYSLIVKAWAGFSGKELQKPYAIWPNRRTVKENIDQFSPDIIIIRECLTPLSLIAQSIATKKNIPTVHYSQAPLQKQDGIVFKLLRKFNIVPRFRLSPTIDPTIPFGYMQKSFYVPLFVPTGIKEVTEKQMDTIRLLFVGKFIKRKNHLLLIEAFNEILKNNKVELTMVGSTVLTEENCHDEVIKRIQELDLCHKITILYDVDPLKMNELYESHDVFVLPSVDEPFSISPLEAMSYGLPVIVSDTNGCQFHVKDGRNGFVIKSNDLKALIQSLRKIVDTENIYSFKEGAFEYAQNENNEIVFVNRFNELIHAVITEKK